MAPKVTITLKQKYTSSTKSFKGCVLENFQTFPYTWKSKIIILFIKIFRLESHVRKLSARDGQIVWSGLVNLRGPHSRRRGCNVV